MLIVAAIAFLASGLFFSSKVTFVSYFPESIDGLSVGAPVKFQGIPFGQVEQLGFYGTPDGPYAEVVFTIDVNRARNLGISDTALTVSTITQAVQLGLRSQLQLASMVTGIVFLELGFRKDAGPPIYLNPDAKYVEIPATPSPMAALSESAGEVIARLASIDVRGISDNLILALESINTKLNDLDVERMSDNLGASAERLRVILEDPDILATVDNLAAVLEELRETNILIAKRMRQLDAPLEHIDSASVHLENTLAATAVATGHLERMLDPESDFRRALQDVLEENARTTKSLRHLFNMLERNPRALIGGKNEDRK